MLPEKNEEGLYIVRSISQLDLVKNETFVYAICHKCKLGWTSLIVNARKILERGCMGCCANSQDEWQPEIITKVAEKEKEIEVIFQRGDKVDFKGNKKYRAVKGTYVWSVNPHEFIQYVIEHPDGLDKSYFMASMGGDGFESIPSKELQEGLKYIYVEPSEIKKA